MTQRFARLERMLLAESFAVLVEPVKKPAGVVTSDQPFFDPGAGPSKMSVTQPNKVFTVGSPVQATRDVSATQPVEASGTMRGSAANITATQRVEAPGTVRIATQPVEALGARSDVDRAVDRSLTSKRTVAAKIGVSETEDELDSEPESPAVVSDREVLSDMDPAKDDELDQEFSEEANYTETMGGVHSFMGWHQIPDFDSSSFSLDGNPFAGS